MIIVKNRPSIELKTIEFDLVKDGNKSSKLDEFSKDIGRNPYIEIGNLSIDSDQVIQMQLFNDQFLPRLVIQFRDTSGQLIDPLFPIDDTIIKVFIQSDSDTLMPIRMDFKITNINPIKSKSGDNYDIIFSLTGIMDVNYLYKTEFTSIDDTSYNSLEKISSDAGLGFASNIDNTSDKMVWINPAHKYLDFSQEIIKHSYISQSSFMCAYVDFYYNLNYIDIETALNEDISDQMGVMGNKYIFDDASGTEELTELVLTNHPDRFSSNVYIDKYNLINKSTAINLEIGYLYHLSQYDTNGNILSKLILDNISTTGTKNNNIIMKGGISEVSELSKESIKVEYTGKLNVDNTHEYYLYSEKHNENNLKFLQKVKLKVTLNKTNFNLYRFQKINIKFYKTNQFDEGDITNPKTLPINQDNLDKRAGVIDDDDKLNQRLSGEWLITSINYTFDKKSGFEQDITLAKRELSFNDNDFDSDKTY